MFDDGRVGRSPGEGDEALFRCSEGAGDVMVYSIAVLGSRAMVEA